jgi:transcriptional regulator with XRE-family HTH domain
VILLRRVLGDALRARRQAQHRTLREVSGAANVSLGYLSEIERGQKEASSELLSAICDALGAQLSEVLRDVSDTMELAELTESGVMLPEGRRLARAGVGLPGDGDAAGDGALDFPAPPPREPTGLAAGGRPSEGAGAVAAGGAVASGAGGAKAGAKASAGAMSTGTAMSNVVTNFLGGSGVAVAVHREGPLRTTLRATRGDNRREVVGVA